jgi:hypothetical protein
LPDTRAGEKGAAGFAVIKDGRYDTADGGRAVAMGQVVAVVRGYDGKASGVQEASVFGKPLFKEHAKNVQVAPDTEVIDFDIPAERI